MCRNSIHSLKFLVAMIWACCQFSACAAKPKAPPQETAQQTNKCIEKKRAAGEGCVETLIPYENAYEIKLKGDAKRYSIPNAAALNEDDLWILKGAEDQAYPIRLKLKGQQVLGIEKLKE